MHEEKTHFFSGGYKLDASFYFSDTEGADDKPTVITCSGFQGLKDIHPARFARALTARGYNCFGFDYRGFAKSEGEPGDVKIEDQIEDIINAGAFVNSQKDYSQNGIILIGWGMGGGLVLKAALEIENLRGLVPINGFYSAKRVQKTVRSSKEWDEFREYKNKERQREANTGDIKKVDPFLIYPLDKITKGYVDSVLRKNDDFGIDVYFSFAHSLLKFNAEESLDELSDIPVLIAHGDQNMLHPVEEAQSLYEKYPGEKELYFIKDAGHTEWMFDDNEKFKALVDKIDNWIASKTLAAQIVQKI